MPKVDLELVKMVLQRNDIDLRTVAQVIEDLNEEIVNSVDEEKPKPVKKQFVMMVSDPHNEIPQKDFTGWVLQIPEEDSVYLSEERLIKAAYAFNQTPKGRRLPVKTIGEACEHVATRLFKEENIWVKTKEPVYLLKTSNQIPWESKG